ncbi:MAG: hypothetical protein U1F25_03945 [Rubrivivax sp.]
MGWIAAGRAFATLLALLALGQAEVFAQAPPARDPKLAPEPAYFIKNNGLGFGVPVPTFRDPMAARAYIEGVHLSWPWTLMSNGTVIATRYCPAAAIEFTKSEFVAPNPAGNSSAETPFKPITRQTANCWSWNGNACADYSCRDDPTQFAYNMRADCPVDWTFVSGNGPNRCECPAGTELERNPAGEWRCAVPQVASVANPACYRGDGSCPVGNLGLPGIAAKVHTETDYEGAGAHPLSFTRSFRSQGARPYVEPGAWSHWVHNWARRIDVYPEPGYRARAYVIRDDASQRIYSSDGRAPGPARRWATGTRSPSSAMPRVPEPASSTRCGPTTASSTT